MAETNKVVNIIAPAGVIINWQGITGYTKEIVIPTTMIKRLLAQNCIVEEVKDDGTTVKLTDDNYESDNGGKDPSTINKGPVVDYVEIYKTELKERHENRLKEIGEKYKELFEKIEAAQKEKDANIAQTVIDVPTEPEIKSVKETVVQPNYETAKTMNSDASTINSSYNKQNKKKSNK